MSQVTKLLLKIVMDRMKGKNYRSVMISNVWLDTRYTTSQF